MFLRLIFLFYGEIPADITATSIYSRAMSRGRIDKNYSSKMTISNTEQKGRKSECKFLEMVTSVT